MPDMNVQVALLPRDLEAQSLSGRVVVVFDVLRATTTMTAALAMGVQEICVFGDVATARKYATGVGMYPKPLLCGEENCLPPEGFDMGNSPGAFDRSLKDRTLYMSTTNGTRAILAAREARLLLTGALVNASAVAQAVVESGLDLTLLCAGTNGQVAMEDALGAGAVLAAVKRLTSVREEGDLPMMAHRLFEVEKNDLRGALRRTRGGQNVIAAGLEEDIAFAASVDRFPKVVGRVEDSVVRRFSAGGGLA
jgi:2-phosphosulfolactate phosphatase